MQLRTVLILALAMIFSGPVLADHHAGAKAEAEAEVSIFDRIGRLFGGGDEEETTGDKDGQAIGHSEKGEKGRSEAAHAQAPGQVKKAEAEKEEEKSGWFPWGNKDEDEAKAEKMKQEKAAKQAKAEKMKQEKADKEAKAKDKQGGLSLDVDAEAGVKLGK